MSFSIRGRWNTVTALIGALAVVAVGTVSPTQATAVGEMQPAYPDGAVGGRIASEMTQSPPLTVLLASDRPSDPMETTVTFTIAADNPGTGDASLTFTSAQVYDVAVFAGEVEVWRWSGDRSFASVMRERSFPPGVTLLGRETWDLRDAGGAPLAPGTYRAVASLATAPQQFGNAVEFTVGAP